MKRRDFLWVLAGSAAASQLACAGTATIRRVRPEPVRYEHPESEEQLVELIRNARANGATLRVRGSGHSVADAIYTDPAPGGTAPGGVDVMLDQLSALSFDDDRMRVTVQAGCHLGMDPVDPAGVSTLENSLFVQLDERGWALPDMGGIIHQSVGGFLSTGSAGGSLQHSVYDSIVGVRLVDGTGSVHEFSRPEPEGSDPDDPFFAAVISMGLLGVVTEVTFQCIPKYHVRGSEIVSGTADAPFRPFDTGPRGLAEYLRRAEHARILWYPQKDVERFQIWQAEKMGPSDYDELTGPPDAFRPRPYVFMTDGQQQLARNFFEVFDELNPPDPDDDVASRELYALTANLQLEREPIRFWDDWWKALPMDNVVDDNVLPIEFTELWIPISHTRDVMVALRDHYAAEGFSATGTNACEIYAAKASPFWLSPAFGQDVLRIDLFWFAGNASAPEVHYYPQFWELLDRFEPRYHWGKHLPVDPERIMARYPKWRDFARLRSELDPDGVFLNDYWAERLGLV